MTADNQTGQNGSLASISSLAHNTSSNNISSQQNPQQYFNNISMIKSNGSSAQINIPTIINSEADSGRASMASNVDQDQYSPTFNQRAFVLNRCKER